MAHAPLVPESKTGAGFEAKTSLRRIACSCGWRGCWYLTDDAMHRSYRRHVMFAGGLSQVVQPVDGLADRFDARPEPGESPAVSWLRGLFAAHDARQAIPDLAEDTPNIGEALSLLKRSVTHTLDLQAGTVRTEVRE